MVFDPECATKGKDKCAEVQTWLILSGGKYRTTSLQQARLYAAAVWGGLVAADLPQLKEEQLVKACIQDHMSYIISVQRPALFI